jgi:RNA polymerase sigma factor (TIGR02999 family)
MEMPAQKSHALGSGNPQTAAILLPKIYEELRHLARLKLARERPGQTLQATALVHEAWLRLGGSDRQQWQGEAHFFGAAAEAMRRILVENARRKQALKHGGGLQRVDLDAVEVAAPIPDEHLLAMDEALDALGQEDPVAAELVKLRFFVGLTHQDAADLLGLSRTAADRAWVYARAWLAERIKFQES